MSQEKEFFESLLVQPVPRRVRRVSPGPDPFAQAPVTAPREPLAIEGGVVAVPAALMKCMQSDCSGQREGRQATVLACFPSGERCPSCDECARYWLGLRPGETWIEPLESYRDPLQEAREALAARTALPPAPQSVTPPPPPVIQGKSTASHAAPPERTSWKSNFARWFTLQATVQAVTPPPPPKRTGWQSDVARWFLGCTGTIILGIIAIVIGLAQTSGPYGQHDAGLIGLGVVMIVATILFAAIWMIVEIAKHAQATHAAWLAQHTPEQIAQIRKAERAALWAGTAVAAVALHEHNKRTNAALTESVMHGSPQSQRSDATQAAFQASWDASEAKRTQQSPAVDEQTAATHRLLARSAALRGNRGWS